MLALTPEEKAQALVTWGYPVFDVGDPNVHSRSGIMEISMRSMVSENLSIERGIPGWRTQTLGPGRSGSSPRARSPDPVLIAPSVAKRIPESSNQVGQTLHCTAMNRFGLWDKQS